MFTLSESRFISSSKCDVYMGQTGVYEDSGNFSLHNMGMIPNPLHKIVLKLDNVRIEIY